MRKLVLVLLMGFLCIPGTAAFTVELKPIVERPSLLMGPADIPHIKARREALPKPWPEGNAFMSRVLDAFLSGDKALQQEASATFMQWVRAFYASNPRQLSLMRRTNEMNYAYDFVVSFGFLTEAEIEEFKNHAIATAKKCIGDDPARFPSRKTPNPWGSEWKSGYSTSNRWTDQFLVAGLVGLNFPEHPLAQAWVQYAIEQTRYQLKHGVSWEGSYNEFPRYHNWTVLLYSGWFQALKQRTGVDFFQEDEVKQLLDWYVRFSSSLVRFPETTKRNPAGEPTLPAWGDSNFGNLFAACAMYAPQYVETDPAFSKRLMWMWRRAGSPIMGGWHFDLIFPLMADARLTDEPQVLGSAFCRTPGYVLLRSGFKTPDETVVTMRGGRRSNWHSRSDLGSIDLFSHGIPLALGSQSGPYDTSEIEWNRSQQSNNMVVFGGRSRDRREASGKIVTWRSTPQADYAVADCSRDRDLRRGRGGAWIWRRHLMLVKNPDYLVVWDEISSPMPSEYFLHTTAGKLHWEEHRIVSRTAYNADLDVHVLQPSETLIPNEKEGKFGQWLNKNPQEGKADPYPFHHLKYFILSAKPDGDFLTVLHPKKPADAALQATLLSSSDENVQLRVEVDGKQDIITLSKTGGSLRRDTKPEVLLPRGLEGSSEPGTRFMKKTE